MEYEDRQCLGLFLLELKEALGEVVEGQQCATTAQISTSQPGHLKGVRID